MNKKSMRKYSPIFLLPMLIAFTIGFIVPFILGVYLSFCEFTTVTDAKFVGLKNYIRFWNDPTDVFVHSLWYTALFAVVSTVLINVLGYAVALADKGWQQACKDDEALNKGLNIVNGKIVYKAVAENYNNV